MAGTLPIAASSSAAAGGSARAERKRFWVYAVGGVVGVTVAAVLGLWVLLGQATAKVDAVGETSLALRDRMLVSITESGEIDAKRSVDVRCAVEGQSTIVWIIEEGTVVKQGDKLIELDSADLQERVRTQDMQFKTAASAYEKADKAFLIQESQRQSLLSAADLKIKFAHLDLKKYLGNDLADRLVAAEGKMPFDTLIKDVALGGEALQEKRKLQSDIDLAGEELSRAASKAEWTRTLKEKGYVTGSELEADELAYKRQQVALQQARTALELFLLYEFPKSAEKFYTDWMESKREYDRVDTRTSSELASAKSDRDNRKQALELETTRLQKVQEQLENTTIKAPQPGMVVYDVSSSRFSQENIIQVGTTVRHQQTLIKLPDMSEMNVKVKLHESVVKQASEGAPAYVTIDAFPKERLTGKVTKVAIMPDRGNFWSNPGVKAYITEVTLDSTPPGLKPGMSAQVEILVNQRDGILQLPISAIHVDKGYQIVYVKAPTGIEVRRVEVGMSNNRVVEILKGVTEGEEVYLFKPADAPEIQLSPEEQKAQQELEQKLAEIKPGVKADAAEAKPAGKSGKGKGDREKGGPRVRVPAEGPTGDAGPSPKRARPADKADAAPGAKAPDAAPAVPAAKAAAAAPAAAAEAKAAS